MSAEPVKYRLLNDDALRAIESALFTVSMERGRAKKMGKLGPSDQEEAIRVLRAVIADLLASRRGRCRHPEGGDVMDDWTPPRCKHGHIILGCPRDDCVEQNEYLASVRAGMDAYEDQQRINARLLVRESLGLPTPSTP